MDETAIPALSASGNRRRLPTRTWYAKIRRRQREVSFCVRQRAPLSCGRGGPLEKALCVSDSRTETRKGRAVSALLGLSWCPSRSWPIFTSGCRARPEDAPPGGSRPDVQVFLVRAHGLLYHRR